MSSPVKNGSPAAAATAHSPELQLVAALARHLLSPSIFENASPHSKAAALDGLRCLATLDGLTQQSLPLSAPAATTSTSVIASRPPAPATSRAPELRERFGSQRGEYRDGLGDNSVIQALLDYHHRTRVAHTAQAPLQSFEPQPVPRVAASPKRPAAYRPGTTRVFRSRGD